MSWNKKESVAMSSVVASFCITVLKLFAGIFSGSIAILSEAAHSALDMGAALLTFFAVRISGRPADETHPYGHGKVESVSALIATGLLFVTSFWIITEASRRLFSGSVDVHAPWFAFAVVLVSIAVDASRAYALKKVAKETRSQALEADALHFSSDILSSTVVLIGLIFVHFNIVGADAVAAIGVAIFVACAGYRLGHRTIDVLVDAAPAGIAELVRELIVQIPNVSNVGRIRVRTIGPSVCIDCVVEVDRYLPLDRVGQLTRIIEELVKKNIPEADILVHTKPTQDAKESLVSKVQRIALEQGFFAHSVMIENVGDKRYVSYDLEVPETLSLGEAHNEVSRIEGLIYDCLGGNLEISTHIDPLEAGEMQSEEVSASERGAIERSIEALIRDTFGRCDIHKTYIRRVNKKLFIVIHYGVDKDMLLRVAHDMAATIEYLLKQNIEGVKKTVVHMEPN